jgi:hypothetical protein
MAEQEPSTEPRRDPRPTPSPYMLSVILVTMGLWFLWDGFFSSSFAEEHPEHLTFNRVGALLLLGWGAIDFYRMRKLQLRRAAEASARLEETRADDVS